MALTLGRTAQKVPLRFTPDGLPSLMFKMDEDGLVHNSTPTLGQIDGYDTEGDEWNEDALSDLEQASSTGHIPPTSRSPKATKYDVVDLAITLHCRARYSCDSAFPLNPVTSELGILTHIALTMGAHGVHDKPTDTISVLDPSTGLPMVFNSLPNYPLAPTLDAHGNHALPFHFGFVVEWPSSEDHYVPALLNARMELWVVNRWIRSYRFPSWERYLDITGK